MSKNICFPQNQYAHNKGYTLHKTSKMSSHLITNVMVFYKNANAAS